MTRLLRALLLTTTALTAQDVKNAPPPRHPVPILSDRDRLAIRELQLKVEHAYKAYTETPAYMVFLEAQMTLHRKVKEITPDHFQLIEDPQTGDLKFVEAQRSEHGTGSLGLKDKN
jgi:hypothetical protein